MDIYSSRGVVLVYRFKVVLQNTYNTSLLIIVLIADHYFDCQSIRKNRFYLEYTKRANHPFLLDFDFWPLQNKESRLIYYTNSSNEY